MTSSGGTTHDGPILEAYLDETGTQEGAHVLAVGGYLGTRDAWRSFTSRWSQALSSYQIPAFHMTDFVSGKKDFKGWPKDKKQYRIDHLIKIINGNVLGSAATGIPLDDFRTTLDANLQNLCGGPYCVATLGCMTLFSKLLRGSNLHNARIAYVCETGVKGRGEVQKVFNATYRVPKYRDMYHLDSFRFDDKRNSVPLQAADILVREFGRQLQIHLGMIDDPMRKYILGRLRERPPFWGWFRGEELRKYALLLSQIDLEPTSDVVP